MGGEWHRFFWDGGSVFDAWLNLASSKLAQILLAIPYAWAHAGLPSAIVFQLLHFPIGWWSGYMIHLLYLRYKSLTHKQDNYTIQFHEVLGEFMGKRWKPLSLILNVGLLFTTSIIQFLACSNIIYPMNNRFEKRTWTLIFGAIFFFSILIPSAQNYRAFSFIGLISTVYTAFYLFIVGISHEQVPTSSTKFTTILHAAPVEIMDAMWKPQCFKTPWLYALLYGATITLPSSMSIFWRFGDRLLAQPNALVLLPKTVFRDVAVVLLIIHQFIIFGIFALPFYMIFEKMFKVHDAANFAKKIVVRIPVFLLIWLAALAFPSFYLASPVSPFLFVAWNIHILPCGVYVLTFWKDASKKSGEKPFSLLSWEAIFAINLGIVLWMTAMSVMCLWADIEAFRKQAKYVKVFAKCYNCD